MIFCHRLSTTLQYFVDLLGPRQNRCGLKLMCNMIDSKLQSSFFKKYRYYWHDWKNGDGDLKSGLKI